MLPGLNGNFQMIFPIHDGHFFKKRISRLVNNGAVISLPQIQTR